jgi:hypothetical protein
MIAVAVLTAAGALVSPSPFVLTAVGATLCLGIRLLWPTTDAPILFLPFALQWMEVAVKPIQTALVGRSIDDLGDFGEALAPAAYLASAGVAALAIGMRVGLGARRGDWAKSLALDASRWRPASVVGLALGAIIVGHLLAIAANHAGPARETVLSFSGMKDGGLFVLAYWCLSQRRLLGLLALVVGLEIVVGLTGFFSVGFRQALFVLIVAAAAAKPKVSVGTFVGMLAVFGLLLTLAVFWSAIKPGYRTFLNEGTGQQVVLRPMNERLSYLGDAANDFTGEQMGAGLDALISRTSYIDFLAKTMQNVPSIIPFQDGRQTSEALTHIVTPRILFPDKPPTPNDTEVTAYYTKMTFDMSGATSISIGYLGELYIDFGIAGAICGAFIFGFLAGKAFHLLRSYRSAPLLLNYGVALTAATPFSLFETALIKVLGSTVAVMLACFVLQRWFIPPLLRVVGPRRAAAHA